jgi:hypothetical protein
MLTVAELTKIHDAEVALSQIDLFSDVIEDLAGIIELYNLHKDFLSGGGLAFFLQLLSSTCVDVVNVALSGLDRLLGKWEIAEQAAKVGLFEKFVHLITTTTKPNQETYTQSKASDCLAYLLAPSPNKHLKQKALEAYIFDPHAKMLFSPNENLVERGLQFLWCMTNEFPPAQKKVCEHPHVVDKVLATIVESDAGKKCFTGSLQSIAP